MADSSIITAADYADALTVARRAKNWLFLLLLLMLLAQIVVFFVARNSDFIVAKQVEPSASTTQPVVEQNTLADVLQYLTGLIDFLGMAFVVILALVLLLIVHIMLVGRLVGVARVTSALVWCFVLGVLLFPWQAFLNNATFTSETFKIPGVLYTWSELVHRARAQTTGGPEILLYWARFVGFPLVAVVILLTIQAKSNRGLRQAMGETSDQSRDTLQTTI
jgi:hypothetical protein